MKVALVGDSVGVSRMIAYLQIKLSNQGMMGWLAGAVNPFIRQRAQQRFDSEGDDASGRWTPLEESTHRWREFMGVPPDHPINVRTGEMESYITQSMAAIMPEAGGVILRYPGKPPSSRLGEKVKTAQMGKPKPSTPARPVLALGMKDMNFTLGSLALYIQAGGSL